jgi:hypothetical protein
MNTIADIRTLVSIAAKDCHQDIKYEVKGHTLRLKSPTYSKSVIYYLEIYVYLESI